MNKQVYGKKLSRERDTRRALFRALTRALVEHGKINTTLTKAKAVQPMVEKLMTLASKNSLTARRRVFAILGNDKKTTKTIFEKLAPSFSDRKGGYTRLTREGARRGDQANIAKLEWVEKVIEKEAKTETKKTKAIKKSKSKEIKTKKTKKAK